VPPKTSRSWADRRHSARRTSTWRFTTLLRKRGGWLAALFLGEMLTANRDGYFEAEIARAVVLALSCR